MANTTASGTIQFDLIDHAELTQYARLFWNEVLKNQFTLQEYLPERNIDELNWSAPRGGLQDVEVAEYRPWDVPAPMTGRPGTARIRGELAPLSRAIPLGEEEGLRLRSALRNDPDPLIRQAYADTERMLRSVAGRLELARADVLIDGKFTLDANDNGVAGLEADFEMPADNKITTSVAWKVANAATATIVDDLLEVAELATAVGADLRNYDLVMSALRRPALQVNEQLLDFAASGGTTPQRINMETIQGIFTDEGLPTIRFYDTLIRRGPSQTSTRVLPENRVLLIPKPGSIEDPVGETLFGPTAEAVLMIERGIIDATEAPGVVAVVLQSEHPVQTTTVAVATAVPTLVNPELVFSLNIGA